nr:hypothetical protein GCM10025730_14130 [Promicromonospora thailandica]
MTSDPESEGAREQAEAPHPTGVRGLRDELLTIATDLTGPGRSGLARRSAVGLRATERLQALFAEATEGSTPRASPWRRSAAWAAASSGP